MNIIHATSVPTFMEDFKAILTEAKSADIAVGYFFMSGFTEVARELSGVAKIRILVGRTDREVLDDVAAAINHHDTLGEYLAAHTPIRRSDSDQLRGEAARQVGRSAAAATQTDTEQQGITRIRDLIAAGRLEIRAYLKERLHAKAYICRYDRVAVQSSAIVGSSNFSLAGFAGNTELNVRFDGREVAELEVWFENLWQDAADLTELALAELNRSWAIAHTNPYDVYIKALYELYHSETGGAIIEPGGRGPQLANFQMDAVRRGLDIIAEYGGCYIGDVVGLGKTFIGAKILEQLKHIRPRAGNPLIICPASLAPMWREVNQTYQLGADVVSQSNIAVPAQAEWDEEQDDWVFAGEPARGQSLTAKYPNNGPVLIDEAHHFRNSATNRYQGVKNYLQDGDHQVVLLSATPQNLSPMDIYHQISAFMDDDDHGLPIEPPNLQRYFRAHAKDAADSEEARRAIQRALTPIFIRRRRRDIIEIYGDSAEVNGQPVRFPAPKLDNLAYQLDQVYAEAGGAAVMFELLAQHKGARYQPLDYLKRTHRNDRRYDAIKRSRGRIAGLIKTLMLKRLESSVHAFRNTLDHLIGSNRNFRNALEAGYVPTGRLATRLLTGADFDPDDMLQALAEDEADSGRRNAHPTAHFNIQQWLTDLEADAATLAALKESIKPITAADDDKLDTLRRFLESKEIRGQKALVFSESRDTVEYLYRELNPGGANSEIAMLSSRNNDNQAEIIARFSPGSNQANRRDILTRPIRILFATDVLSEGQNLQDCHRVINYDLHWNPIKLIQRFGRVDRIGSTADTVYLHNMWPDTGIDETLSLTDRVGERIQSFHNVIGHDSQVLSADEKLNTDAMYRIYAQGEMPERESDDPLSEGAATQNNIALLQRIRDHDPELYAKAANLPDGIRAAVIAPEGPHKGQTIVMLARGRHRACYAVGDDLRPALIGPDEFLALAKCDPHTPPRRLPANTNARVTAAYRAFRAIPAARLLDAPRRTENQRYILRELNRARGDADADAAYRAAVERMRRIYLNRDYSPNVDAAIAGMRREGIAGRDLTHRLDRLADSYGLRPAREMDPAAAELPPPVRTICSDGLA